MTANEFGKFAAAIKTFYPKDNILPSDESMELWYEMLSDLDYNTAYRALGNHVRGNQFPPTIADLRNEYRKIKFEEYKVQNDIRELYDKTIAVYPSANREVGVREVYYKILGDRGCAESFKLASRILSEAEKYVRQCEKSCSNDIPTLKEFLEGRDWG